VIARSLIERIVPATPSIVVVVYEVEETVKI
jgi:hypothetical protein